MAGRIMVLAGKDVRLFLTRGQGLAQAVLLGVLLIFTFSLAAAGNSELSRQWVAAIFWLATCFCQVLIFNALYAFEDTNRAREGLLLAPLPAQGVWAAKTLAGGLILLVVQMIFVPACAVFLNLSTVSSWPGVVGVILLVDIGIVVLGGLLGAVGRDQAGRDSLLTVIFFPLLLPLLLAGIRLGSHVLGASGGGDFWAWIRLAGAFDAVFSGLALFLFPVVYRE